MNKLLSRHTELRKAYGASKKRITDATKGQGLDLSPSALEILLYVQDKVTVRNKELSIDLAIERGNLSHTLNRLKDLGLVTRTGHLLTLTDKGKKCLSSAREVLNVNS